MPKERIIEPINATFEEVVAKIMTPRRKPNNDVLKVLHAGSFWDILDFEVDCYVLNDKDKTAVIGQQGF